MKKKWIIAERKKSDLIDHLLDLRGVRDREVFLNPSFAHRHDPFLMSQIDQSVDLLTRAVRNKRKIGLYGDYDCDGIPGTALLWRALRAVGSTPAVYIPRREVGYGLNREGIDALHDQGVEVLVTIDNGTTAVEQVSYARQKNIEVIITDHHQPQDTLPDALILNPKLPQSTYPFTELCGSGVVYKLIEGLAQQFPEKLDERWLKWHLDLVALATICDMVELTGENRVFAKYGLMVLKQTKNKGLQALLKVAGLNPEILSAGTVGFGIGPRINAAGRMESDPMLGFRLLTTEDENEAGDIARELQRLNTKRQDLVSAAVIQAEELMQESNQSISPAIVLAHPEWTAGILGLIAAKLLERYHKPVFVFDAASGKGSARSISDYPLPDSFSHLHGHLVSYGGHAMAGGMVLKQNHLDALRTDLHAHAATKLGNEEQKPHLHIDALLLPQEITMGFAKRLSALEPFGIGNPKPIFTLTNVALKEVKTIGSGNKHLRGVIQGDDTRIPFVAFGQGEQKDSFIRSERLNIAGKIEINTWNGRESAELHIVDTQSS